MLEKPIANNREDLDAILTELVGSGIQFMDGKWSKRKLLCSLLFNACYLAGVAVDDVVDRSLGAIYTTRPYNLKPPNQLRDDSWPN